MQTDTATSEIATVFANLKVGDMVEVHTKDAKPRMVRVMELPANELAGRYVFTSSGKVRFGHIAGGIIRRSQYDNSISFQPTIQQQVRPVTALLVVGTSH